MASIPSRPANGRAGLSNLTRTLRAAVYHRVSSEEQVEGYSLDAQSRATRQYCEAHGWPLMQEYRDEGKSARTDDLARRPAFARMLEDAESRAFDVVVVHKLDRFARNLRVTLETLERLDRSGVAFVSISEQMDFTTPIGKVILATLAAFAQYYSDNLSAETKKGKYERKAQGMWNGLLPFGVKKNADGLAVPDPDTYPGLLLAFRRCAEGKSDREIADALNAAGYRTTGNRGRNPFTKDTVRRILLNRFFLGELPDGAGGWISGAHAPMLDGALYDEAQSTRAANRTNAAKVRRTARRHALSGLATCGHCGAPMQFRPERTGRVRALCSRRIQRGDSPCRQRSQFAAGLEDQIARYLGTFRLPDETVRQVVALYEKVREDRDDSERRRREIANRLERIAELYKWGDLTREAYQDERDRLQVEQAGLKRAEGQSDLLARAAAFLQDLPSAWAQATPEQRNALARLVFVSVEVTDDRVTAIVAQPDFAPFFLVGANENTPTDWPGCQDADGSVTIKRKRRDSNPRSQP